MRIYSQKYINFFFVKQVFQLIGSELMNGFSNTVIINIHNRNKSPISSLKQHVRLTGVSYHL